MVLELRLMHPRYTTMEFQSAASGIVAHASGTAAYLYYLHLVCTVPAGSAEN